MKQLLILIGIICCCVFSLNAQTNKELRKEREEITRMSKNALQEKATKTARKEAKKLEKEGWKTSPGTLPIEKQIDKSYLMQMEYDNDLFPKYIMAEAISVSGNYDAAKMQALELAKQNLAAQIQTEVTALVENTVANEQNDPETAASITRSIMSSKNLISQSIGRVLTVVELYRTLPNKNKEVLVRIAYSAELAKKTAIDAMKKDLESKGDELHNKLDEVLGWTKESV